MIIVGCLIILQTIKEEIILNNFKGKIDMKKIFLFLIAAFGNILAKAEYIPFSEGVFLSPAPIEYIKLANQAASLVGYEGKYELSIAEKAAKSINPLNFFITSTFANPVTKNSLIIINPDWFNNLSTQAQIYFLAEKFVTFQKPFHPNVNSLLFFYYFCYVLAIILFMYILHKFSKLSKVKSIFIIFGLSFVYNIIFGNNLIGKLQTQEINKQGIKYNLDIDKKLVAILNDKNIVINNLQQFLNDLTNKAAELNDAAFSNNLVPIEANLSKRIEYLKSL